jgi:hypothetical protein
MGIARVRPSRNIYEFSFTVANLPDAESKSCTIECTGLPNRGILRRVSLLTQDGAAISAQDVHMFLLSSAGSATSNSGGDTALTTVELNSAFYVTSFRLADAPEALLTPTVQAEPRYLQRTLSFWGRRARPRSALPLSHTMSQGWSWALTLVTGWCTRALSPKPPSGSATHGRMKRAERQRRREK